MAQKILVIEDDKKLQELLENYLDSFGYEVRGELHPEKGLEAFEDMSPDLVILDIMLPDMNGFDVCRRIRSISSVPVIMLTARGDVMDRVAGLEIGADDYVPKPFEPRELVARIQSVLRRVDGVAAEEEAGALDFGRLQVDLDRCEAELDGDSLGLTTNEFAALSLLVRNAGKVLDRDRLLQELRGLDSDVYNRSVDITMSRLRQKLGDDPKSPDFIKTVWGSGYMFIARRNNS